MIYIKTESSKYKDDFIKKFTNFGDKSPILLSFACDDLGVTIVHEGSGSKYFYQWDFTMPIKSFIHMIKQDLSDRHYPRLSQKKEITRPITSGEIANMMSEGVDPNHIPANVTETIEDVYRIDKVLAMKDEFILINEKTKEQFCYSMDGSSIFFLKNYRTGKYTSTEEAGEAFFKKSKLKTKLTNV